MEGCPYCGSEKFEFIDTVDVNVGLGGGSILSEYVCNDNNCGEYFYVETFLANVEHDIRKTKRR